MKTTKPEELNFTPFEIREAYTECRVNPDNGNFMIITLGKVENMKDYGYKKDFDYKENPVEKENNKKNAEIFRKFLINYISMKNVLRKERRQIQDYIMKHSKKWF